MLLRAIEDLPTLHELQLVDPSVLFQDVAEPLALVGIAPVAVLSLVEESDVAFETPKLRTKSSSSTRSNASRMPLVRHNFLPKERPRQGRAS